MQLLLRKPVAYNAPVEQKGTSDVMHRIHPIAAFWTAVSLAVALQASAQSPTLKLADKLADRAQDLNSSIRAANLQIKKTLESYNYIVQGKAQDPRTEYRKLVTDLDKCLKSREQVRLKADGMQQAAAKYFESWEASLDGYNDPEMKAKSEERLASTRESYLTIFEVGSGAGDEFETFISKMDDQIRFLGQDLSPGAIADLTEKAADLNEQSEELFRSISETLKVSSDYATSLKPR